MNTSAQSTHSIQQMLTTHPHPSTLPMTELTTCVEVCTLCAAICTSCADACLAEEMVHELLHCIRTNLDCADICQATAHVLVRQTEADWRLLYHQLQACQMACRACAAECEQHAHMHEHCRVCAEACRHCEQACDKLLVTFPV